MDRKKLIFIFMAIGAYAGSWLPTLWGAGMFSFSSVILSAAGGIAGIWLGFRLRE